MFINDNENSFTTHLCSSIDLWYCERLHYTWKWSLSIIFHIPFYRSHRSRQAFEAELMAACSWKESLFFNWESREKDILVQVSKPRFFTEFENRGLFPTATQQGKKGGIYKLRKKRGFEICSNIFSPLIMSNKKPPITIKMKQNLVKTSINNVK